MNACQVFFVSSVELSLITVVYMKGMFIIKLKFIPDFCKLNNLLMHKPCPVPTIEETLQELESFA